MTNYALRSLPEAETHRLLSNEHLGTLLDWSPERQMVVTVFTAMWNSALSARRVNEVAGALCAQKDVNLNAMLTELTRHKILRSRVRSGERHYEVNY